MLVNAVRTALKDPKEPAAVLALEYAEAIDAGGDLAAYGPKLLSCLDALLLTPRARAAVKKVMEPDDSQPASPLDELRARRAARQRGASAVDAAAS